MGVALPRLRLGDYHVDEVEHEAPVRPKQIRKAGLPWRRVMSLTMAQADTEQVKQWYLLVPDPPDPIKWSDAMTCDEVIAAGKALQSGTMFGIFNEETLNISGVFTRR